MPALLREKLPLQPSGNHVAASTACFRTRVTVLYQPAQAQENIGRERRPQSHGPVQSTSCTGLQIIQPPKPSNPLQLSSSCWRLSSPPSIPTLPPAPRSRASHAPPRDRPAVTPHRASQAARQTRQDSNANTGLASPAQHERTEKDHEKGMPSVPLD